MIEVRIAFSLILFLAAGQAFATPDPAAGKEKSALCAACHGPNGVSPNDLWPNLIGQKEQYIVKQLQAFRDGQRNDPLMSPVAKMLSDKEIQDVAKYYADLK